MTNSEICERIARRYCDLMKLNPDDVIQHGGETLPPYSQYTARWQWIALKVPEQLAWIQAVAEVMG
jgi:hypothetical protein